MHPVTTASCWISTPPHRRNGSCIFPLLPTVTSIFQAFTCSCLVLFLGAPTLPSHCSSGHLQFRYTCLFIIGSAKRWLEENSAPSVISTVPPPYISNESQQRACHADTVYVHSSYIPFQTNCHPPTFSVWKLWRQPCPILSSEHTKRRAFSLDPNFLPPFIWNAPRFLDLYSY